MTQTILVVGLTLLGTVGVLIAPILGVAIYYLFAVLRPQSLWYWVLPNLPWSFYVAMGTMLGAVLHVTAFKRQPADVHRDRRPFGWPHVALFMFAVWVSLSYVWAHNQQVAYPWYEQLLKMVVMFFVCALLIQTLRHVWILMIVTAGALGYIAYDANFEYLTTGRTLLLERGYGGLDNNGAALMLAMGVPLCVFIYVGTKKWWRWIFAALIPVILHAVLMTLSRGSMVALLVAAPFMFLRKRYRAQLGLAALAVAAVVPLLAGEQIRQEFFSVDAYEEDGSAQSRFTSWAAAIAIAKDNPIVGVGTRNSDLLSFDYGADSPGRAIHNQYLQVMADSGYPALGFYLLLIVFVSLSLRRVRKWAATQTGDDGNLAYAIACGLECSLIVYYVGVLFLTLDGFELPFLIWLLAAQLPLVLGLGRQTSTLPVAPAHHATAPSAVRLPRRQTAFNRAPLPRAPGAPTRHRRPTP
jgi:probable O-glycosylation ligase (exosortase A-associated)